MQYISNNAANKLHTFTRQTLPAKKNCSKMVKMAEDFSAMIQKILCMCKNLGLITVTVKDGVDQRMLHMVQFP